MNQYFIFFFLYWIVAKQKLAGKGEDLIRMRKVSLFSLSQLGRHFIHARYSVLKRQWSGLWFFFIRNYYSERGSMWGIIKQYRCVFTHRHRHTHRVQTLQALSQCHHISTPISILYLFITKATIAGTLSINSVRLTASCLFPSLRVEWTSSYWMYLLAD